MSTSISNDLYMIKKVYDRTFMTGNLTLMIDLSLLSAANNIDALEIFDTALDMIVGYRRINHIFEIAPKLNVSIITN